MSNEHDTPYGYCHCGCGQTTPIATRSRPSIGHVKGEPVRFVLGHNNAVRAAPARPDSDSPIPLGLCQRGGGQKTSISAKSNRGQGRVAGEPMRYVVGHSSATASGRSKRCAVDGCEGKHKGRGFCNRHLVAYRKHGTPTPPVLTPEDRFWANVLRGEGGGCWEWQAGLSTGGYGAFKAGGGSYAHRFSYELHKGPIPEGLQIDHLCRNRKCVNPTHLEAVTLKENVRRGLAGPKTHCPHGHEFTEENIYRPPGRTDRQCRKCRHLKPAQPNG